MDLINIISMSTEFFSNLKFNDLDHTIEVTSSLSCQDYQNYAGFQLQGEECEYGWTCIILTGEPIVSLIFIFCYIYCTYNNSTGADWPK